MRAISNGGVGRAVVFVHGNSLASGIWQDQWDPGLFPGAELIAVDLPGHGESAHYPVDRPYGVDALALDLADFLSGMTDVVLVGHSLGGHVCVRTLPLAPQVIGVLLLGAPPLSSAADLSSGFLPHPSLARVFTADLTPDDVTVLATAFMGEGSPWISRAASMILRADPRVRSGVGEEIGSATIPDEQRILRSSGIPIAMVHGERDPFISIEFLERLAPGFFWQDRVHTLRGAGHCPQLQRPEDFNSVLRKFLEYLGI